MMGVVDEGVGQVTDQRARASISNQCLMRRADTVELWKADTKQRQFKTLARLTTVAMRHEKIRRRFRRTCFQIAKIADDDFLTPKRLQVRGWHSGDNRG